MAATCFFEKKTRAQLIDPFKPVVAQKMRDIGTVHAYNNLIGNIQRFP